MALTAGEQAFLEKLQASPTKDIFEQVDPASPEGIALVKQLVAMDPDIPGGLLGYLDRAKKLLEDSANSVNPFEGCKVEVPQGVKVAGPDDVLETEALGLPELSKCAFCLVAGGLGERLGYPGIKIGIAADLASDRVFLQMYCDAILALQARAQAAAGIAEVVLPLAIMTSGDTHAQTEELLAANDNFGMAPGQITLMKQAKVPALMDSKPTIALNGDKTVATKPHGHGDVHSLLYQTGIAKKWVQEGRQWLLFFQDTNPLVFRVFPSVLGVSVKNDFAMNSLTVPRVPKEALGSIACLRSPESAITINVEYNIIDSLLKETPAGGDTADESGLSPFPGNINILLLKLPSLVAALDRTEGVMPEFVNPKYTDATKTTFKSATRLECMMQDVPRLLGPQDKVGFSRYDRQSCFTCVKNCLADAQAKFVGGQPPESMFTCEADIYADNARLLKEAVTAAGFTSTGLEPNPKATTFLGISQNLAPFVVLYPSFAPSFTDLKDRIKGDFKIAPGSVLIVEGDVTFEGGLELDGALVVKMKPGQKCVMKGTKVKTAGWKLVEASGDDLPDHLKIRGYAMEKGLAKVVSSSTNDLVGDDSLKGGAVVEGEITIE